MLRLLSLLLVSLLSLTPEVVLAQQQQCPLCVGGAEPNLLKTIGGAEDGPSCSSLVMDVEIDLEGCRDLQILGYRWCDCPDYPEDFFCPMCKDAFTDIPNRFKEIPGTGKTCDEKLFVKASSVDSCADAMKPGYACGCPEAEEPHCTICGGAIEDDAKISKPDELLTINEVGSFTCQELADNAMLGVLTVGQCALVQAEAFDTCGCVGSNPSPVSEESEVTAPGEDTPTTVPVETDAATAPEDDSAAISTRTSLAALFSVFASPLLLNL